MLPALALTLIASTQGCGIIPVTSVPQTVLALTTTQHLAVLVLGGYEGGAETYLFVHTQDGYQCVSLLPGGVVTPHVAAKYGLMLRSQSLPVVDQEILDGATANGRAHVLRLNQPFVATQGSDGYHITPLTRAEANAMLTSIRARYAHRTGIFWR